MLEDVPEKKPVNPDPESSHSGESNQEPLNWPPPIITESYVPPPEDNHPHACKKDSGLDWARFVVEVLTLFALVWYANVASHQLIEMHKATQASQRSANAAEIAAEVAKKAVDISEKSFRVDERPYVTVYSINPKTGPLKEGENTIDFRTLNSGKTPALSVKNTVHMIVGGKRIAEFSPNGRSEGVIAGGKDSTNNYTLRLSSDDAKNGASLQLTGAVEYIDVFGDFQYQTTFCARYDPNTNQFKFCPSGNTVK